MPDSPELLVEKDGHVVTVVMNRPEARNAFSAQMLVRMVDAWESIDADDDVRVAILTGSGGHFCAGADLKTMFGGAGDDEWTQRFQADSDLAWRALLRHYRLRKPLIAAVEGYAVAGGTEILQGTDIRVAGKSAIFGLAEVTRGLFPLGGSTVRLPRQIPYARAMEILLTGDHMAADEALRVGLINRVVDDGEALAEARAIADRIARNAPLSAQAIKRSVQETAALPEQEALKIELEIGLPIFGTDDAREGTKAFAEKRPPRYEGK